MIWCLIRQIDSLGQLFEEHFRFCSCYYLLDYEAVLYKHDMTVLDAESPVFLLVMGVGWSWPADFFEPAKPWVRCSISWCAVAMSCSFQSSCLLQVNEPKNPVI